MDTNHTNLINDELIEHLAELSLLYFQNDKKEKIKQELNKMTSFYNKINTFPLNKHTTNSSTPKETTISRKDIPSSTFKKKDALKNANNKNHDFFIVPKIISKD